MSDHSLTHSLTHWATAIQDELKMYKAAFNIRSNNLTNTDTNSSKWYFAVCKNTPSIRDIWRRQLSHVISVLWRKLLLEVITHTVRVTIEHDHLLHRPRNNLHNQLEFWEGMIRPQQVNFMGDISVPFDFRMMSKNNPQNFVLLRVAPRDNKIGRKWEDMCFSLECACRCGTSTVIDMSVAVMTSLPH